jgi:hypothetical protein
MSTTRWEMQRDDEFGAALARCTCCEDCHQERPCDGAENGPGCDTRCECDELEREDVEGYDPNACPGCGGNCQVACR